MLNRSQASLANFPLRKQLESTSKHNAQYLRRPIEGPTKGCIKIFFRPRRARRRSILRWRRTERDLLPKLPQWSRHSLLIESRRCRSVAEIRPPPQLSTSKSNDDALHFSFSGGGWLMVYMYGVCKALREQKVDDNAKFIGTSAGCLSIVSLVLNSDFDKICDFVVNDYVPSAHASWKGPFKMRDYLIDAITRHGNVSDMDKLQGKVTVVYTSLSAWVTRRVSHFKNPLHLLQTMVASCCATPLVGFPFMHEGEYVIDGGLLDNQPLFADDICTITVTPNIFANADIRPSRYVPPWWSMYPPSPRDMQWLFDLGYEDGLSWCKREGLPGSESITVPTKAAEYDGEWKTVIGQMVGYKLIEDVVLAAAELLLLSEDSITCNFVRLEILLWKLVAILAAVLDRMTVLWAVLAVNGLLVLVLLDQHYTIEFILVLGGHLTLALVKVKNVCMHVHSWEKWRVLQGAVLATEKQGRFIKHGLTPMQHELLTESIDWEACWCRWINGRKAI
ncbi:patatin-like phospholipase, putative [Phytophthora infestans T30-4]|uniref:Patatin-like phospholipase, putative n=1 Tax=Phytophthora infestans (strain T30-4) TaxID=403677 RepID=D0NW48_PHYIT|nr:patatin-like phospholipase, putative [Phytophthora infestans T30-4]EEY66933.1 patatin-like phospholipase, putative [Phytophthora infestans T30-4]|eukprot:XP_002896651.1 patatin-like phospholipase, putative [Phytophthora infestans T30-4]